MFYKGERYLKLDAVHRLASPLQQTLRELRVSIIGDSNPPTSPLPIFDLPVLVDLSLTFCLSCLDLVAVFPNSPLKSVELMMDVGDVRLARLSVLKVLEQHKTTLQSFYMMPRAGTGDEGVLAELKDVCSRQGIEWVDDEE